MPSLSQKHRPKTFADITGQTPVTETLQKEIATGILGHAYLFSGPRGIGKTTAARVFAKALNCESPKEGEPCNACGSCISADQGRFLDIIELDAATHTGVDTVREAIVEHVRVTPISGKRKVYILDEVHMFSTSSWNALLKTLEEPPQYAFFILATTEWHKVPATIISRCQRFEFKRVSSDDLKKRLEYLATCEEWRVDPEVFRLIISRSDGCVRDAEMLLGQLGSLGVEAIDMSVAGLVIPPSRIPQAAYLLRLWADREHASALKEAQKLSDEGLHISALFDDLLWIIRHLVVASGDKNMRDLWARGSQDERAITDLVDVFSPGELHDMALLLLERRRDIKSGVDPLFALLLVGTMVACGLLRHSASKPIHKSEEQEKNITVEINKKEILPELSSVNTEVPSAPIVELSVLRLRWTAIIACIEEQNHSLPFILKITRPEAVNGEKIVLRFQYSFHRDKILLDPKHRHLVESSICSVAGIPRCTLEGVIGEDVERKTDRARDMVSNVLHAFGGTVVE